MYSLHTLKFSNKTFIKLTVNYGHLMNQLRTTLYWGEP